MAGAQVCIQRGGERWCGAAGNLAADQPFFIASTTKLFTAALVLGLADDGRLDLDAPLGVLLPPADWAGVHVWRGVDRSGELTIRQLLSQTSGVADYFGEAPRGGASILDSLVAGVDRAWTPLEAVARAREIGPRFAPGTPGKAFYSDTNYQLLGRVVEAATGQTYGRVLAERVLEPLGLRDTWLWTGAVPAGRAAPAALRHGRRELAIPAAMASSGPDGGVVSTACDLLAFLLAFFGGDLFSPARLPDLQRWNRIFFPFQYGTGLMRFQVPRVFSPFKRFPALIGHSGLSGAFAFHCPERDIHLAGTVNQVRRPGTSFKLQLRLLDALEKAAPTPAP